jgi:hypothetical protein
LQNNIKKMKKNETSGAISLLCDYLDVLQSMFATFDSPVNRTLSSYNVPVDIGSTASAAAHSFNRTYKKCHVEVDTATDTGCAMIRPIEGSYGPNENLGNRATAALKMFLLDLFIQRKSHDETGIKVRIFRSDDGVKVVTVEIQVPAQFLFSKPLLPWHHPPRPISDWHIGRGFYSSFSTAISLGATRLEVSNSETGGVIRFDFIGA